MTLPTRDASRPALGQRLAVARARRRLKQSAVADLAGISQPTYSRIESGLIVPSAAQLVLIAEAVGVDPMRLGE